MSGIINYLYSTVRYLCLSEKQRAAEEDDRRFLKLEPQLREAVEKATSDFWKKHGRAPTMQESARISRQCYLDIYESFGLDMSQMKQSTPSSTDQQQKTHSAAASFLFQSNSTKPKTD